MFSKMRLNFLLIICLLISSCGESSTSSGAVDNLSPSNPSIDNPSLEEIRQQYSGSTDLLVITHQNVLPISSDILYWKDVLRQIILSEDALTSFEHPINVQQEFNASYESCESGTSTDPLPENQNDYEYSNYTMKFTDCVNAFLIANGAVQFRLTGPNIKLGDIDSIILYFDSDYRVYDKNLSDTYSLFGSVEIFSDGEISVNLSIKSDSGKEVLFGDTLLDDSGSFNSGSIYLANQGYLLVQGNNDYIGENELFIESKHIKTLLIPVDPKIIINFETLTNEHWYGVIGFDTHLRNNWALNGMEVPYEHYKEELYSGELEATQASFLTENVIAKGDVLRPHVTNLTSPGINMVKFQWRVKDLEGNTTLSSDTLRPELTFDQVGEFTLTLTVENNFGKSAEYKENIYVFDEDAKLDTSAVISIENEISIDSIFQAKLNSNTIDNLEYSIAYGPAGMEIDQDGKITWRGEGLIVTGPTNHNFGVLVREKSSQKFTIIESKLSLLPAGGNVTNSTDYNLSIDPFNKLPVEIPHEDENSEFVLAAELNGSVYSLQLINDTIQKSSISLDLSTFQELVDVDYSVNLEKINYLISDWSEKHYFWLSEPEDKFIPWLDGMPGAGFLDVNNDGNLDVLMPDSYGGYSKYNLKQGEETVLNEVLGDISIKRKCQMNGSEHMWFITPHYDRYSYANKPESLSLFYWDGSQLQFDHDFQSQNYENAFFIDENLDGYCDSIWAISNDRKGEKIYTYVERFTLQGNKFVLTGHELDILGENQVALSANLHSNEENKTEGVLFTLEDSSFSSGHKWSHVSINSDEDSISFVTQTIEQTSSHLDVLLSTEYSKFITSIDIDGDGVDEWLFLHTLSVNDLVTRNKKIDTNGARTYQVFVAAKVQDGQLLPIYLSNISTPEEMVSTYVGQVTTGENYVVQHNGNQPFVFSKSGELITSFLGEDYQSLRTYVLDDLSYYQSYDEYGGNDSRVKELSFYTSEGDLLWSKQFSNSNHDSIEVIGSYKAIDVLKLGPDHNYKWFMIDRNKGTTIVEQQSNLEKISLHPNFNDNGLFFSYPKESEFIEYGYDELDITTTPDNIPGVYQLNDANAKLLHNWRAAIFSKMNVRVEEISWIDVDSNGIMEVVAYFTAKDSLPFLYYAELDGSNIKLKQFFESSGSILTANFYQAKRSNNRCFDSDCRVVIVTKEDSEINTSKSYVAAYDKLSGKLLWQSKQSYYNVNSVYIGVDKKISIQTRSYVKAFN